MNVEVYTPLGNALGLYKNKENPADIIMSVNDRESQLSSIRIHICKHDLIELSKQIQSLCEKPTKKCILYPKEDCEPDESCEDCEQSLCVDEPKKEK